MNRRAKGKLVRKVAKLDRAWRMAGKTEGRTQDALAFQLGQAYRAGLGTKARKVQSQSARRLNQRSSWES